MSTQNINWLTTLDLENFIHNYANNKTKAAFLGVFPINQLPKRLPYLPLFFIINTNPGNLPGQHWKAVFISKKYYGEIFDSLATPVSLKLQQWMNTHTKRWIVSKITLQNPLSPSCGGYVLYYIMTRLNFKSLNACVKSFTNNVFDNDKIVEMFFNIVSQI